MVCFLLVNEQQTFRSEEGPTRNGTLSEFFLSCYESPGLVVSGSLVSSTFTEKGGERFL